MVVGASRRCSRNCCVLLVSNGLHHPSLVIQAHLPAAVLLVIVRSLQPWSARCYFRDAYIGLSRFDTGITLEGPLTAASNY
ncbi:hypothetical protein BU16DRAFT_523239 [Lophium mytilinum]|uniref:Uncharacterized protein n=1 Tax=Lophium mytilinum TaxID=390894 RepID=A0A6A6RAG2_9PEZI|nr:hypothetical protein BU16DRAFT_523239 [Lophium mytilinum]